jgi:spermidine/putrescine transport system ATP-binding protein
MSHPAGMDGALEPDLLMRRCDVASVQLLEVSNRFGSVLAMHRISLEIASGEMIALLGPSGCGKTTTLRAIAGLEAPDAGDIFIDQRRIGGVPIHRRQVDMVFQDYALFPHLTVAENVAFGLKMRHLADATIRTKVQQALRLVRLANLHGIETRYPHQLSGGQRQRVVLARAGDRAEGAAAPRAVWGVGQEIAREHADGIAPAAEGAEYHDDLRHPRPGGSINPAHRIAVIRNGRIEQMGTPTEIYEYPRARFVADFIGVSNFFRGRVEAKREDRLLVLTESHMKLWVSPASNRKIRVGEILQLALRPEKIRLVPHRPSKEWNAYPATIAHIVYLSAVTHFYVQTELQEALIVSVQNHDSALAPSPLAIGDAAYVSWPPAETLILECEGEGPAAAEMPSAKGSLSRAYEPFSLG